MRKTNKNPVKISNRGLGLVYTRCGHFSGGAQSFFPGAARNE